MKTKSRIIVSLLMVVLLQFCTILLGCEKEEEFKPVSKVTFTTGGETITKKSKCRWVYDKFVYVDEEDFKPYDLGYVKLFVAQTEDVKSIPKEYRGKPNFSVDYPHASWEYYNEPKYAMINGEKRCIGMKYKKTRRLRLAYHVYHVKVIDNSTIVLRGDGADTTYIVTSFSASYI